MKNENINDLTIGDFISKKILISAPETSSLRDVHQIMVANEVSHIPLMSANGEVRGVLSERDVRSFYLAPDFGSIRAHTVMSKKFLTFSTATKLSIVAHEMVKDSHCVVVIECQKNSPLGVFTVSDALIALDFILQKQR